MRVLVVGGAGYVGSHTARALRRSRHDVVIYDNLSTGHLFLTQGFNLVIGDILESSKLATALANVDAIMHFAAHAYVGESVVNPRKYFLNNVTGGLSLLNCAIECGIRTFIFSSSCTVYGIPVALPISERATREPINPYGASKLFLEHALHAYENAYGLKYVTLRYFNAAGADESGEIGELHNPETHLIPLALQVASGAREMLEIYGDDYPTSDGTCIRDYIHVNDLAEGHVRALEYLDGGGRSVALNLGTGKGHSVKEVVDVIERITGPVPRQIVERRRGDPAVLVADPTRARQILNWTATRSLEDIISTARNWMLRSPRITVSSQR